MGMYVVLTAFSLSKGLIGIQTDRQGAPPQDADPRNATPNRNSARGRYGGGGLAILTLYEHSLAIAFFRAFFALSSPPLVLHAIGGGEGVQRGTASTWAGRNLGVALPQHVTILVLNQCKNWQSEFVAVAAIVGLSIFLRQRGSAESKPVADPHRETSA